jgi:hypothetical protein
MTIDLCRGAARRLGRACAAASCAVLALAALSSAALAAPPERVPLDLPPGTTFPFTDTLGNDPCGFEVTLTVLTNNVTTTTSDRRDGTTVTSSTGALKVRLTNSETGQSVERNISGPVRSTQELDGTVRQVTGGRGLFAFDPDVAPGLPRLVIVRGRTTSTFTGPSTAPVFTLDSQAGQVEDLCATLSG